MFAFCYWQPCALSVADGNHGGVETYICPSPQTLNDGVPSIVGSSDRSLRYDIVKCRESTKTSF